jgi:hypothetical protein
VIRDNICSRQCLHILHTISGSTFHKFVVQLMSISSSWCFPGVQSSVRLLKLSVGDKSISSANVNEHLTSLISPYQSMWSNNVSV